MSEAFAGMMAAILVVVAVFFITILTTLFGAIAGWIVGLVFTDTILGTLSRFGVDIVDLTMWQLGATLGFVGGFFKTAKVRSKND